MFCIDIPVSADIDPLHYCRTHYDSSWLLQRQVHQPSPGEQDDTGDPEMAVGTQMGERIAWLVTPCTVWLLLPFHL